MNRRFVSTRRRKSAVIGYILSIAAILILAAILAVFFWFRSTEVSLNEQDMCPIGSEPTETWVVLLDTTDDYSAVQAADILRHFNLLKDKVPTLAKLSLYTVSEDTNSLPGPEVALCNPGSGEGQSSLYSNPSLMRTRWLRDFDKPISDLFEEKITAGARNSSPIMQTIQAIAVQEFGNGFQSKRLFVFSDMLEHTIDYSHYRESPPSFSEFKETRFFERVRSNLSGVDVEVYYIRRDGKTEGRIQGRAHLIFWEEFFQSTGASLSSVVRIQG